MYRIGKTENIIVLTDNPDILGLNYQPIRIVKDKTGHRGALISYNYLDEILDTLLEYNIEDVFFIDNTKTLKYLNYKNPNKKTFDFVNEKIVYQCKESTALKINFYIHDLTFDTYWILK